jgi:hypothetical protein
MEHSQAKYFLLYGYAMLCAYLLFAHCAPPLASAGTLC